MEKDKVVIGGFTELDGDEAERLVNEVLVNCPGFEGAYATNPTPTVVMAKFNTAGMAMKMIKKPKIQPEDEGEQVVGFRKSFANRTPAMQTRQQIEKIPQLNMTSRIPKMSL